MSELINLYAVYKIADFFIEKIWHYAKLIYKAFGVSGILLSIIVLAFFCWELFYVFHDVIPCLINPKSLLCRT